MNAFCDGIRRCRQIAYSARLTTWESLKSRGPIARGTLITTVLLLGGCSWFSNDEPAFPPSTGGPTIATVPNGLPGDSANADYTDQELRALLGNAPRPLPAPPAPPKAADTNAPDAQKPEASTAPAGAASPDAAAPGAAPAAPAAAPAVTNTDPNAYPDINTTPMQRPTPVPDADVSAPQATGPAASPASPDGTAPATDATPPKPQSMLEHDQLEPLMVMTASGSSPAAPAPDQVAQQTAQSVTTSDDDMFSKPVLPNYTSYDQTVKQPQGVPAQQLYRSPYNGPTQLGQSASYYNSSVVYPAQGTLGQNDGTGSQLVAAPGGQPVGLVYFGIGSVQLGGSDRQVLRQIADLQRAYGGVIRIIGHASSRTENMPMDKHQQTNVNIAQARAKAVAQQLARFGVKPLFLQIAGASDTQPLYPEIMPAGEAANRRAEVYLSSN